MMFSLLRFSKNLSLCFCSMSKLVTKTEIAEHNKATDLWLLIDNKVYDMTDYVKAHPGGEAILRNAGGDSSLGFNSVRAHQTVKGFITKLLEDHFIADLEE